MAAFRYRARGACKRSSGEQLNLRSAYPPSDGKRIVTASEDKTARQWDAETGKPIGEPLTGHADVVWSAAFSPDGKRIVTASADTARLWDAETGKPIGEPLTGHADVVWSAAFSPDGKRIVTASADRTARLWDAETGKPDINSSRLPRSTPHIDACCKRQCPFLRNPGESLI